MASAALQASAQDSAQRPIRPRTTYEDLQLFGQVFNHLRVNHPDSLEMNRLLLSAIEGMVRAADPHSYVIPAVRLSPERLELLRAGKLYPIPIQFTYVDGAPVVVSVAPGSATARQDILPGDELVTVNGRSITARSADELDLTLAGPKKSSVTLGFERRRADGSLVQVERRVVRERVEEESAVATAIMLDSTTGYVRVTTFAAERVAADLHNALGHLEKRGMQSLVLDLRDNGGGRVHEAALVAGAFLPQGAIVYTSVGRKKEVTDTGRVRRSFWRDSKNYPIVVMINSGTASASELVAGALQDHDRALIVGRPSFGKSLLMQGFPLADGSIMMLVIGHVRTPCGRTVQRAYKDMSYREYRRLAGVDGDTAGRPACQTKGGRRVFGGGGIYPDIISEDESDRTPLWQARVTEQELLLGWSGRFLEEKGTSLSSPETLANDSVMRTAALASFRSHVENARLTIPSDQESDRRLWLMLARFLAFAKWGNAGAYLVEARLDPAIQRARSQIAKAERLVNR